MKKFIAAVLLIGFAISATAQDKPVQFAYNAVRTNDTTVLFKAKAIMGKGFQIFSANKKSAEDAFVTTIEFDTPLNKYRRTTDSVTESGTMQVTTGELSFRSFSDSVEFALPLHISVADSIVSVKGNIAWLGKKGDEFPSGTD